MNLRDAAQELIELGPRGTLFRAGWELKGRTGLTAVTPKPPDRLRATGGWTRRLQLEDPVTLARALRDRIGETALADLALTATEAARGRIRCFGRWTADCGDPIDWHRSPVTKGRWDAGMPWFRSLADETPGDVKYAWEAARFPHAYTLTRAASFFPNRTEEFAAALLGHINGFTAANPAGFGIHWASGQETGFRLLAWLFALDALLSRAAASRGSDDIVADALIEGARHIDAHLDYARIAVYNNHLLSEALALFGVGALLPEAAESVRWRTLGRRILDEEAERQFYPDGGYIQQSHNYHRVALQDYLWACIFARAMGDAPSDVWLHALERSLDFLVAQQNPSDGRLPNYGSNDGALPSILTTCDFSDVRPILQAISVLVRGERIYSEGPWDESTAWFLGVRALDAPLRNPTRRSVSFAQTGYHVLRGVDEDSFLTFRCGTLNDRFSQIDMLHADVWWRGQNVLVDPGSFQYNAAPEWHEHFVRTASHNTVVVDGRDQMVHHRQFKVLYWTKAALTGFEDHERWARCAGEHYGYRRHPGSCVHRREILFFKDDLWVVLDRVDGTGQHSARLHWLAGAFEFAALPAANGMSLRTPEGIFTVATHYLDGSPLTGDVASGAEEPPRGWLSRYYGEKIAVPSYVTTVTAGTPLSMITVLAGTSFDVHVDPRGWRIATPGGAISFNPSGGTFEAVAVE
jgi:hypothetical protein